MYLTKLTKELIKSFYVVMYEIRNFTLSITQIYRNYSMIQMNEVTLVIFVKDAIVIYNLSDLSFKLF